MKELYSKIQVAGSIKFVAEKESDEDINLTDNYKFSHNLVTILERDREVVAKYLRIISNWKPMKWLEAYDMDITQDLFNERQESKYPTFVAIIIKSEKYEGLFSRVELRRLKPIITDQPVFSWKNIIQRFIPDPKEYEDFENACLDYSNIATRLVQIYVFKKGCYLCELYIKFAQQEGYNIVISEKHKKIYHGWKLPIQQMSPSRANHWNIC
ncbi:11577_t:CDS:2 [Diversispora eburnea]|uniref:11577_t:CDS:1 n=1 Tax=Diversispora eburnea TaxID=1213867 RepID=A0A9N9CSK0_9GLOM|nr:11577_t:CDS:2 [Diversispora eburnea]